MRNKNISVFFPFFIVFSVAFSASCTGVTNDVAGGIQVTFVGHPRGSTLLRIHGYEEFGYSGMLPFGTGDVVTSSIDVDFENRTSQILETYRDSKIREINPPTDNNYDHLFSGLFYSATCSTCTLDILYPSEEYRFVLLSGQRVLEIDPNEFPSFAILVEKAGQRIAMFFVEVDRVAFSETI